MLLRLLARFPGAGRDPSRSRYGALWKGAVAENVETQVFVERWIPAFAGKARYAAKGDVSDWITGFLRGHDEKRVGTKC